MKIKSKVAKFSKGRKIIEVPKAISDNFQIGEEVFIVKIDPEPESGGLFTLKRQGKV